jgi:hypothetical protein
MFLLANVQEESVAGTTSVMYTYLNRIIFLLLLLSDMFSVDFCKYPLSLSLTYLNADAIKQVWKRFYETISVEIYKSNLIWSNSIFCTILTLKGSETPTTPRLLNHNTQIIV